MLTGIRITDDAQAQVVELFDRASDERMLTLRAAIGCDLFDVVGLRGNIDLFIDDEGLYRSCINLHLSAVAKLLGFQGEGLAGQGVFLRVDPKTGESHSLTRPQMHAIVLAHYIVHAGLAPLLLHHESE